jgi:hypothetical protein
MGRYIEDDCLEAEELFERLIGHSYAVSTQVEEHKFGKNTGKQINLKEMPLEIISCEGFLKFEQLLFNNWVPIPIENICQIGQVLDIPPSIFQVPYQKVRVTYRAGAEVIPAEMRQAVQEIADLLQIENVNEWNIPLSPATLDVIGRYRK